MANKKRESYVRKAKAIPLKKSGQLERLCNEEQYKLVRKLIDEGAVFIVLGSKFAPIDDFYKGLHKEMCQPAYNGACIYDSNIMYRKAWERKTVTVSLNDNNNYSQSIVDSIKQLDRYRSRTLYTYSYVKE